MKFIATSLKDLHVSEDEQPSSGLSQQMISDVIDALLQSHEFAFQSKRNALSSNKWLESIGCAKNDTGEEPFDSDLNVVALKAKLNSAECEMLAKREEISRLNEELANCRAEIGRLKSSRTQVCDFNTRLDID